MATVDKATEKELFKDLFIEIFVQDPVESSNFFPITNF